MTAAPAPTAETAASLLARGREASARSAYAEAVPLLEAAVERAHDDADAHYELGLALAAQQRWEDAIDHYVLAAHFAPARPEFREACAEAWLGTGDLAAAVAELDQLSPTEQGRPMALFLRGACAKQSGDLTAACEAYARAAAAAPSRADFWCQLGYTQYLHGDYTAGRASLERALTVQPGLPEAEHNLGLLALETGAPAEALERFRRADAARPKTPEIVSATGHALRDLGRLDDAIAAYDAALALAPAFGDAWINRCTTRLAQGDYARGWAEYEQRFTATGTDAGSAGAPRWQGDRLNGRRLLIFGEQGLGDEIMFASCLPDALARAGAGVTIACDPRLAALFARSFPAATVVGHARNTAPLPAADLEIPIGSLPRLFRASVFPATSRFLLADPARVEVWRHRLQSRQAGSWLALAWRGGSLRTRGHLRSAALTDCAPLLDGHHAVASAQYGDVAADVAALPVSSRARLHLFPEAAGNLDEIAALLVAAGRVVTVDNTLAHLAGALGVPGCVLLPAAPEWRYPRSGERWPWYPSLRLVQWTASGWPAAFAGAADMLGTLAP
jgi:tetratricopeptide (TPR) repeat protein